MQTAFLEIDTKQCSGSELVSKSALHFRPLAKKMIKSKMDLAKGMGVCQLSSLKENSLKLTLKCHQKKIYEMTNKIQNLLEKKWKTCE
jgi:hypothetical protein